MDIIGYLSALIIGIVLGLVGGGGSILTVPVLVYLVAINPVTATAYSLFIVGTSSLVGALHYIKKGMVDFRTATVFAIPSFTAVYLTRKFLVPAIPDPIFTLLDFEVTKGIGVMIFFAVIMIAASVSMIKSNSKKTPESSTIRYNYPLIILEGVLVGTLTGIVGAGGGFLIIPALVLFAGLPMKKAVATSLLIIAIKSLIGFIGDIQNLEIGWAFLLLFSGLTVLGILLGGYLNALVDEKKLKKGFGWFVFVMGIFIFWKELF